MINKETLLLLTPLLYDYDSGYDNKPIGDGNPYYACAKCGISDPQINGSVFNHGYHCKYAIKRVMECCGFSREDAIKIIDILSDDEELEVHKKALHSGLKKIISNETGFSDSLVGYLLTYTNGDYVGVYNSLKSVTGRKSLKKIPKQKPYDVLVAHYKKDLKNVDPNISFKDLFLAA